MLPAPKHRPCVPPEEFLTPTDRLLMQRESTLPTEGLPGLVDKLPEDAAIDGILFRYDVTPDGGMRNREWRPFINCPHCKARHWRGFVIELKDGAMALLGEDCGEKQHQLSASRIKRSEHSFADPAQLKNLLEGAGFAAGKGL
jgi:hypothetical protein